MKLRLLLAHFAEVQNGMLFALGLGWTLTGPAPSPFSVAGIFEVDWNETNRPHDVNVDLLDGDGQPVMVPTPAGDQPLRFSMNLRMGRPPDAIEGQSFIQPFAINVGPIPLQPGRRYIVRAMMGGMTLDECPFSVRPAPVRPAIPGR